MLAMAREVIFSGGKVLGFYRWGPKCMRTAWAHGAETSARMAGQRLPLWSLLACIARWRRSTVGIQYQPVGEL